MDQVPNRSDWPGISPYSPPPPLHIKHRLLLYGANSEISHTHCLMDLSPQAIREVDSLLEGISIQIWNLPLAFPKAGLHALLKELGRNIPSIWEDYCGAAIRSWTQILNDRGGGGTRHHRQGLPSNTVGQVPTLAP